MPAEHTPEPWRVRNNFRDDDWYILNEEWCIAHLLRADEIGKANAARIVACVNACKGLSNHLLETIAAHGGGLGVPDELAQPVLCPACGEILIAASIGGDCLVWEHEPHDSCKKGFRGGIVHSH